MATPETNWFGDITLVQSQQQRVQVQSVEHIVKILNDPVNFPVNFPGPVRAVGSRHSPTQCGVADGGTLLEMQPNMCKILNVGTDSVTAQAGARYIDVVQDKDNGLHTKGLQFFVNTEFGSLSLGSAACAGTKDSSMPGESGQVGSYVTGVKIVFPNTTQETTVTDQSDPVLMQMIRSSYGLLGIITEVTIQVRPLQRLQVRHQSYTLDEFLQQLDTLKQGGESMFLYMFPFNDPSKGDKQITVEFRKYNPAPDPTKPADQTVWPTRNALWRDAVPSTCYTFDGPFPVPEREQTDREVSKAFQSILERLQSDNTDPSDQIIRYPEIAGPIYYTFNFCAFKEADYPKALGDYFAFCKSYQATTGYRSYMGTVGYRVAKDTKAFLSYATDDVMTIDPVTTGSPVVTSFVAAAQEAYRRSLGEALNQGSAGSLTGLLVNPITQLLGPLAQLTDKGWGLFKKEFNAVVSERGGPSVNLATLNDGWHRFLDAFNDFASDHGGIPLFNQTVNVKREWAVKAFGNRLDQFEQFRKQKDPQDRLLNDYFRNLLQG